MLLHLLPLLLAVAPARAAETLVLNETELITLDANAGDVTAITVPEACRWLSFRFVAAAGFYDDPSSGLSDSDPKSAHALTFDADTWFTLRVPGSGQGRAKAQDDVVVFLAHTNAAGVVQTLCTDGG